MKAVIKTLSNSNLCPDTAHRLALCIRDAAGSVSYCRNGTGSMNGPLHLLSFFGGDSLQIAVPLDAAFVEFRVKNWQVEERIHRHQFDDLLLRQGGYQKEGNTVIVTCLNAMVLDVLNRMAKVMAGKA